MRQNFFKVQAFFIIDAAFGIRKRDDDTAHLFQEVREVTADVTESLYRDRHAARISAERFQY